MYNSILYQSSVVYHTDSPHQHAYLDTGSSPPLSAVSLSMGFSYLLSTQEPSPEADDSPDFPQEGQ